MRKVNYVRQVFCLSLVFLSLMGYSQTSERYALTGNSVSTEKAKERWNPIKLNESGTNVLKGVSFFSREIICNSNNLIVIKLINSNSYPVRVSSLENGIKKIVSVPASSEVEGTCELFSGMHESNPMKDLVFTKPKTDAEKAAKEKLVSTILVEKEN